MKHQQSCSFKRAVRRLAAIISLLLIGVGAALAQGASGGGGAPAIINPKGDTVAQTNREAALRSAEIRVGGVMMDQQHLTAAIERTKQDFKRIQMLRNEMVDRLVAQKPLDFKLISEQAAEINRRANRLKTFMMSSAVEEKDKEKAAGQPVEYNGEQMKGALVKLCNTIHSFTNNPMFKDPDTVDATKAGTAGGDLMTIIDLSDKIKTNAERLSKVSK